jgi:hypothetical protein
MPLPTLLGNERLPPCLGVGMSKCKCAKRIAALERDVTRLRAQLPREIHHAVVHEIKVAEKEPGYVVHLQTLSTPRNLGTDTYTS